MGALRATVIISALLFIFLLSYPRNTLYYFNPPLRKQLFEVQSIDTMKYSRDNARQMLDDPDSFDPMIDAHMQLIAEAGATHAAIDTPYDKEFLPVIRRWVASARKHNLSVFFRGNFSGWEKWFQYPEISRVQHEKLLRDFLRTNPDLFQNGDVFTPCPECENGGPGDPRQTGDASGYNAFLVAEKNIASTEFLRLGKRIAVYPSMNADIARQIITPETVRAFGGVILIDHYVRMSEQFADDIRTIPQQLKARVGLGEFGAPVPDLNGDMTQAQQARYVDSLFKALYAKSAVIPVVNYWTLRGGSTLLVNDDDTPRTAYFTVRNYFMAFNAYGTVYNSLGENVAGARVSIDRSDYAAISGWTYQIFVPRQYKSITITADGYIPVTVRMPASATTTLVKQDVRLEPINPDWWYATRAFLYTTLRRIRDSWKIFVR